MTPARAIQDLPTPCLLLDRPALERNCRRMRQHVARMGVALRPHLKTAKSVAVAERQCGRPLDQAALTVSTLREAEYFLAAGVRDITYAVGIAPARLDWALDLVRRGCRLTVICDQVAVAAECQARARAAGASLAVLIEIDVGQGRGGLAPESPALLAVAQALAPPEPVPPGADRSGPGAKRRKAGEAQRRLRPQPKVCACRPRDLRQGNRRTAVRRLSSRVDQVVAADGQAGPLRPGARLAGVLAHAGQAYGCADLAAVAAVAQQERAGALRAAERLRAAGHACPVVSIGSTPTVVAAQALPGVSEVRPGVYCFMDRFQERLGVCGPDDLALTVATRVIAARPDEGVLWLDAGALALSTDRSLERLGGDGYGELRDAADRPLPGRPVVDLLNQEHGRVRLHARLVAAMLAAARPPASNASLRARSREVASVPDLGVGALVRVRPNHACLTAAGHPGYWVLDERGQVEAYWERCGGW